MPVGSAEVDAWLLFAGLFASGETAVIEPIRTRDHSELALRAFGAELKLLGKEVRISGRQRLRAIEAVVPGDISSAMACERLRRGRWLKGCRLPSVACWLTWPSVVRYTSTRLSTG